MSFGVLGSRGAGISDHFGVEASKIDIITASLSNAFSAAGGFCAGSCQIVDHQRLAGQAYTFSASLPAMLAVSGFEAIQFLETDSSCLTRLRENTVLMHSLLKQMDPRMIVKGGVDKSPVFHLSLLQSLSNRVDEEKLLQEIVDLVRPLFFLNT